MSPPVYKANNSPPRHGILPYSQAYYAFPEYGLSYSTAPPPSTGSASGYMHFPCILIWTHDRMIIIHLLHRLIPSMIVMIIMMMMQEGA